MNSEQKNQSEQNKKSFVRIIVEKGESTKKEYFFKDTFRIGREDICAIKISDGLVSREHLEISIKNGEWWISDLFSSNGTFLNDKKIEHIQLSKPIKLELGKNGPIINLELISESDSKSEVSAGVIGSLTSYIQRYFDAKTEDSNAGHHTRMIQQAFQVVKKKQSKKYLKIIFVVLFIAISAAAYSIYKHIQVNRLMEKAKDNFYSIQEDKLKIDSLIALNDWRKKQYEEEIELLSHIYNISAEYEK